MSRPSKTEVVKVIQSHCGTCWDDEAVYTKDEWPNIRADLKEYWASGFGPYRVITRRIPK